MTHEDLQYGFRKVLDKTKPIGHLNCIRRSQTRALSVLTAPVSADDPHFPMIQKPSGKTYRRSVWE